MAGSPRRKYVHNGQQQSSISPEGFNPNGSYYKTCCCHVKKFTISITIIEIFLLCFLIVAVIPDISSRICYPSSSSSDSDNSTSINPNSTVSPIRQQLTTNSSYLTTRSASIPTMTTPKVLLASSNQTVRLRRQLNVNNITGTRIPSISTTTISSVLSNRQITLPTTLYRTSMSRNDSDDDNSNQTSAGWYKDGDSNPPLNALYTVTCGMNMIWLLLALIHLIAANVMFFGVKTVKWFLFIPHITCRIMVILIIILLLALLVTGSMIGPLAMKIPVWTLTLIGVFFIIPYIFIIYIEIKCAHFIKLSGETGFSLSNTRPVGQPTVSLSDSRPQGGENIPMQTMNNQEQNNANGATEGNPLPPLRHTFR